MSRKSTVKGIDVDQVVDGSDKSDSDDLRLNVKAELKKSRQSNSNSVSFLRQSITHPTTFAGQTCSVAQTPAVPDVRSINMCPKIQKLFEKAVQLDYLSDKYLEQIGRLLAQQEEMFCDEKYEYSFF